MSSPETNAMADECDQCGRPRWLTEEIFRRLGTEASGYIGRVRTLESELAAARENQVTDHFIQSHVTRALYDETKARAERAETIIAKAKRHFGEDEDCWKIIESSESEPRKE